VKQLGKLLPRRRINKIIAKKIFLSTITRIFVLQLDGSICIHIWIVTHAVFITLTTI